MEWFAVTFAMYRDAFSQASVLAARNWPVLLSLFAYSAIMTTTGMVAVRLGILGGFLASIVWAACSGSFLYLVEMIVRTKKVTFDDFRRSFIVYLSDVLGVMFVFWIASMFLTPLLLQSGQAMALSLFTSIAIFVLFNAVPELIYLGHHSSLALLAESYRFISSNWIEWFPANLLASGLVYAVWALPLDGVAGLLQGAVLSLLVYFVMVMRGLLFLELAGSSYRSRLFKYRARH